MALEKLYVAKQVVGERIIRPVRSLFLKKGRVSDPSETPETILGHLGTALKKAVCSKTGC